MKRQQKPPRNRSRRTAAEPGVARLAFDAAGSAIARHPTLAAGAAAFCVVFAFVSANAIWYQPGGHPAPLLATRTERTVPPPAFSDADPGVRTIRLAQPAPRPQTDPRTSQAAATVEDVLAGVPTRRVESVSYSPNDDLTSTASIPAPRDPKSALPENDAPVGDARVAAIQRELARLGLYRGEVDGLDGPKTRAALRAFGAKAGLSDVPQPSDELIARLKIARIDEIARPTQRPESSAELTAESEAGAAPLQYRPPLDVPEEGSRDDVSEIVRDIQQGLVNIAYSDVAVDGIVGSKTRAAIRDFQGHYRLPPTGEPSQEVLAKLEEIGAL